MREAGYSIDMCLTSSKWFTTYKGKDKKFSFSVVAGWLWNSAAYIPCRGEPLFQAIEVVEKGKHCLSICRVTISAGQWYYGTLPWCNLCKNDLNQLRVLQKKPEREKEKRRKTERKRKKNWKWPQGFILNLSETEVDVWELSYCGNAAHCKYLYTEDRWFDYKEHLQ